MKSISSIPVGLLRHRQYRRSEISGSVASLAQALSFRLPAGSRVLLKPNLVSVRGHDGLACTHPEFVAGVAQWCLDQGCRVKIGDSPAFGRGMDVMAAFGISRALRGMDVAVVPFAGGRQVELPEFGPLTLAAEALECDFLINLPKIKAHSQTLVSLAVKNYFGVVKGLRKAIWHQRLGHDRDLFARLLVTLTGLLPGGITFADGIEAMHDRGPVNGTSYPLGVMAASVNPVALDTALLQVLGIAPERSPVWRATRDLKLPGWSPAHLAYPLRNPAEVGVDDFRVPALLKPVAFRPLHVFASVIRRIRLLLPS